MGDEKIETQRFTNLFANMFLSQYDEDKREEAARLSDQSGSQTPITMGVDSTGFPIAIMRSQYNVSWKLLLDYLSVMGYTPQDRNQSQGTIETSYKRPKQEFWNSIDEPESNLEEKSYIFIVGDLENRTSIHVTDAEGKPIDKEQLTGISNVLRKVLELKQPQPVD